MVESVRWDGKIGEVILAAKMERKKEIKTGKDFWATENCKFDSNDFYLKNLQNICKWDLVLFISSCITKWRK
jgi:hypothetical protein